MRFLILASTLLLLAGCSCSKKSEAGNGESVTEAGNAPVVDAASATDLDAQAETAQAQAQAESFSQAASAVHAYLAALAAKDWPKADAYWAGGKPPPRLEDSSLRSIEDLRSLRINNDPPLALDSESPARTVEVPVTLRIRKDNAAYQLKGWYRLRRTINGDSWEITSASLQPTLD